MFFVLKKDYELQKKELMKLKKEIKRLNKTLFELSVSIQEERENTKKIIYNAPKVTPERTSTEYLEGFNYAWNSLTSYLNNLWI